MNKKKWIWIMLFSRLFLFFLLQLVLALTFIMFKVDGPWYQSEKWWPFTAFLTNVICFLLLIYLFKKDNKKFFDIIKFDKTNIKRELLHIFIILLLIFPIAFLPNILLSTMFFGDPLNAVEMIVRPLPVIAIVIIMIIFPLSQGLIEIPVYFSYVMPKLKEQGYKKWATILIPSIMLGLQHIAVPFIFDIKYLVWRGLMFIPFAIFIGIVMNKNSKLFPYLAIIHILMDLSFVSMFFIYAI